MVNLTKAQEGRMGKALLMALLLAVAGSGAWAATAPVKTSKETVKVQAKTGKRTKKKLNRQDAFRMQKKAEKESKNHGMEMRRREFLQAQEAQRRGMMQMQQQREREQQTK
jgi:hypothetical protein